jgi:hypothetical protein
MRKRTSRAFAHAINSLKSGDIFILRVLGPIVILSADRLDGLEPLFGGTRSPEFGVTFGLVQAHFLDGCAIDLSIHGSWGPRVVWKPATALLKYTGEASRFQRAGLLEVLKAQGKTKLADELPDTQNDE